jgi:hypothetical protein
MRAWSERKPWRFSYEVHKNGRKHFFRLNLAEPIPIDWAVILGEAVHDLRSALDQAVYWLTIDWEGTPLKLSSFPVYMRQKPFVQRDRNGAWSSSGGMYKIRGIGPGPQTFIEGLQPYPQRYKARPACFDLRLLHELWNKDKHRLVHIWGLRHTDANLRLHQDVVADCVVGLDSRVLQDGAIVVNITCDPPHSHVGVEGQINSALSIYAGKRKGGGPVRLLDIYSTGADIIRKLVNAIGRQDEPISLDIWTVKSA